MSYSIAISVVSGEPKITQWAGDLPAGAAFTISGHEPLASYARRSVGVSVYGPDSLLMASAGASVDLPPAAVAPAEALVPAGDPGQQAAEPAAPATPAGAAVAEGAGQA